MNADLIRYIDAKLVEGGIVPEEGLVRLSVDSLGGVTATWPASFTPQQIAAADAFLLALDKSPAAIAAWKVGVDRQAAFDLFMNDLSPTARVLRSLGTVILNKTNAISGNVCPKRGPEVQFVWDPASMANGAGVTSPVQAYPNAQIGDLVEVSPPVNPAGVIVMGFVPAANQVQVRLQNGTGGAVNPPSGTWAVRVRAPGTMPPDDVQDLIDAVIAGINTG